MCCKEDFTLHMSVSRNDGIGQKKKLHNDVCIFLICLPSGKLIKQWNIPVFNRKYIFNPGPCSSQLC